MMALSAHNLCEQEIKVTPCGTAIELRTVTYDDGFAADCDFDKFTVKEDGFYYITYEIFTDCENNIAAAVFDNCEPIPTTICSPKKPASTFTDSTIAYLKKDDVLSLDLFGECKTVKLQPGSSANLNVIKIAK